jgi:cytidine deaminase
MDSDSIISKEQMNELALQARKAAELAYAPYSNFRVGAALLCEDGSIVTGANVENRSYGLTTCAERNAISTAVSNGMRCFLALAISTPDSSGPVGPCGACRQVLSEFMPRNAPVRFGGNGSELIDTTIGELFPWDVLE